IQRPYKKFIKPTRYCPILLMKLLSKTDDEEIKNLDPKIYSIKTKILPLLPEK
ncbi:unnamed protein product, partial [marine sediment metagenome]